MGNFLLIYLLLKIADNYGSDEESSDNDVEIFDQVGVILIQSFIIVIKYSTFQNTVDMEED